MGQAYPEARQLLTHGGRRGQPREYGSGSWSYSWRMKPGWKFGLPPSARDQQVEQDRTSFVLIHYSELARPTAGESRVSQSDRLHHDPQRAACPQPTRHGQIPQGDQGEPSGVRHDSAASRRPSMATGIIPSRPAHNATVISLRTLSWRGVTAHEVAPGREADAHEGLALGGVEPGQESISCDLPGFFEVRGDS